MEIVTEMQKKDMQIAYTYEGTYAKFFNVYFNYKSQNLVLVRVV